MLITTYVPTIVYYNIGSTNFSNRNKVMQVSITIVYVI